MVTSETHPQSRVITLRPNRSASWAETRLFIYLLCGTTLAVGVFWALVGAWAVLPFSGLEAGLVAFIMYRVSYATYQRQTITITADHILVQSGTHFPRRSWRLNRAHSHLAVIEAPHPLDPPGLSIFDAEHNVELGRFLNRDDKALALRSLKQAGLFVRSHDQLASAAF